MIELIRNYAYDNSYDYIKTFSSRSAQDSYFNSLDKILINDNNYVKEHLSFKVAYNYDYLVSQGVNYVIFNNGYKDIYAFIVEKEYVSEEVTRLNFEIDVIQTYMFDFNLKKSFIERKVCGLNEITDYDEGLEMGEHIIESVSTVATKECNYFAMFTGFKDYVIHEKKYDYTSFNMSSTSRPKTVIDGITYPLLFMPLAENGERFNNYLLDHESLVGIIRLPKCTYTTSSIGIHILKKSNSNINELELTYMDDLIVANEINSAPVVGGSVEIAKGTLTDFYPYTYYVLTDGETEPLMMEPQYLQSTLTIKGKTAISNTPVERYYPGYYKGSTDGTIYNITNTNNMSLPVGRNTGLESISSSYNSFMQQGESANTNMLMGMGMSAIGLVGSAMTGNIGGMVGSAMSAYSSYDNVKNMMARRTDMKLTPNSIKSMGTPSTRNAFGTDKVKVIKYTIQDKYKERINNYIYRYGNKYNNYGTINLKTYKGFIKFNEVNISTTIDNEITTKIKSILERGVYVE